MWTLLCGAGLAAVRLRTGSLPLLIVGHFVLDGLERLAVGQQAADAPPAVLALMIAVGIVLGAYGWWAARQESNAPEVPLAHDVAPEDRRGKEGA